MVNLIKKLFCRKDYVEFLDSNNPLDDRKIINSYFEKIYAEKGKIIRIENIESGRSEFDDGTYTDKPGIYNYTTSRYFIHYKCYKQINYEPSNNFDNLTQI